jgi:hypothetical protein
MLLHGSWGIELLGAFAALQLVFLSVFIEVRLLVEYFAALNALEVVPACVVSFQLAFGLESFEAFRTGDFVSRRLVFLTICRSWEDHRTIIAFERMRCRDMFVTSFDTVEGKGTMLATNTVRRFHMLFQISLLLEGGRTLSTLQFRSLVHLGLGLGLCLAVSCRNMFVASFDTAKGQGTMAAPDTVHWFHMLFEIALSIECGRTLWALDLVRGQDVSMPFSLGLECLAAVLARQVVGRGRVVMLLAGFKAFEVSVAVVTLELVLVLIVLLQSLFRGKRPFARMTMIPMLLVFVIFQLLFSVQNIRASVAVPGCVMIESRTMWVDSLLAFEKALTRVALVIVWHGEGIGCCYLEGCPR